MATGGPVKQLCEELTCSLCLDYFDDPVTITECGHNFCRGCLAQCWGESEDEASCPLCKVTLQTRNLPSNRQLANVVEIAKELNGREEEDPNPTAKELNGREEEEPNPKQVEEEGRICEKHQEPFKLFCQQDQLLICLVCRASEEHRSHEVVLLEKASQEYRDKFNFRLEIVREERAKRLAHKEHTMKESQGLLTVTQSETQRTVAVFGKLRQFLEEKEKLQLGRMAALEEEIARKKDEHLARDSHELSCLDSLIRDMEEKLQQPDIKLLQDGRSIFKRYEEEKEKFGDLVAFPPELNWKACDTYVINDFLEDHMRQFKAQVNVTLDPATAHHRRVLSKDRKSVCRGWGYQNPPNNPERFGFRPFVMGCEQASRWGLPWSHPNAGSILESERAQQEAEESEMPAFKRLRLSLVRHYFIEHSRFWANCIICQMDVKIGYGRFGTASLLQHLKQVHPGLLEQASSALHV